MFSLVKRHQNFSPVTTRNSVVVAG